MIDLSTWTTAPKSFDPPIAFEILDQVSVTLASRLPDCTARRYDSPIFEGYSPVELCFTNSGPVVPKLSLFHGKYYSLVLPDFYYSLMLRDFRDFGATLPGPALKGSTRLDTGVESIVSTLHDLLIGFDFLGLIAAANPARILSDKSRQPTPRSNFNLAVCAIYEREYEKADSLLIDCLKGAREDYGPTHTALISEAERYRTELEIDARALNQELIATMNNNWAHFKIVSQT